MATGSPFKFLDSYTKEDKDIFFGRDQEIEEVYKKVFQGKTLFIYGESGTGKSSLVNCGLANRFKNSDWLPVNVRRGDNMVRSLISEVQRLTLTDVSGLNGSFDANLFKYTRSLYLDYFKPIYFIFDQFEELYLMGSREEWREFIGGIKSLAEKDLNVHFIFIIRSEYLHFMSEFEEELPQIFNNKLRVERITRVKARECIEGPCKVAGIKLESDFADKLFDQLSPASIEVELTYLQVYLDRVFKMAEARDEDKLTFSKDLLEDIGLVSDVLSDFLDEQIESMPDKEDTLTILKAFVTVEGTKRQATIEDILSFTRSLGKPVEKAQTESLVKQLVERRIIKELPEHGTLELRHDALANKIFEKITIRERELIEVRQFLDYGLSEYQKRGFLLNEQDLAYIQPHLPTLDLAGEVEEFVEASIKAAGKRKRVRNRVIAVIAIILILLVTAVLALMDSQKQREKALQQQALAEENAEVAEEQRGFAVQNASMADLARQEAELSADEASRQADIAMRQRRIAEQQRIVADSSRSEAERQRALALIQKDSAEVARAQALFYLEQANVQRERAEMLSMQTLARSLGIKSAQLADVTLKSLLARQAFLFNARFDGYEYQSDIHNALYLAYKANKGPAFNEFKRHSSSVNEIIMVEDGILTAGSEGAILKWSSDLSSTAELTNTNEINYAMALSKDQSTLAVGTSGGRIQVLDPESGEQRFTLTNHQGRIWQLAFTATGKLISSAEDMTVRSLDLGTNRSELIARFQVNPLAIGAHPASDSIVVGLENGSVLALRPEVGADQRQIYTRGGDRITELAFDKAGGTLAIGHESGSIVLFQGTYEAEDSTFINSTTLPGHTARVSDIKFSTDDRFMISGGYDRKNLLWNLAALQESPVAWTDHELFVLSVGFTPESQGVVSGDINGLLKEYRIEMDTYAHELCQSLDRNLSAQEWQNLVREDVAYEQTCNTENR